jgi:lipoprotein NlpI
MTSLRVSRAKVPVIAVISFLLTASVIEAESIDGLLQQATEAAQRGEHDRSIRILTQVMDQPSPPPLCWYLRGRENFRALHVEESVADFDKYVELEPRAENRLWERGISSYYAGQFGKGAKQFEDYQKFHNQDVENSAWRYLCVARDSGVEKARSTLLPITDDPRVPMMHIYGLYQAKLKPENVLVFAGKDPPNRELENQRLFYAHLYIGLWYEVGGDANKAKQHIFAAEKHRIAHYMWDVAHVHAEKLRDGRSN